MPIGTIHLAGSDRARVFLAEINGTSHGCKIDTHDTIDSFLQALSQNDNVHGIYISGNNPIAERDELQRISSELAQYRNRIQVIIDRGNQEFWEERGWAGRIHTLSNGTVIQKTLYSAMRAIDNPTSV